MKKLVSLFIVAMIVLACNIGYARDYTKRDAAIKRFKDIKETAISMDGNTQVAKEIKIMFSMVFAGTPFETKDIKAFQMGDLLIVIGVTPFIKLVDKDKIRDLCPNMKSAVSSFTVSKNVKTAILFYVTDMDDILPTITVTSDGDCSVLDL